MTNKIPSPPRTIVFQVMFLRQGNALRLPHGATARVRPYYPLRLTPSSLLPLVASMLLLLILSNPVQAQDPNVTPAISQGNGVLTGQVINGTTNQAQGDIEVTLRAFQDNVEIVTLTTQVDGDGRYVFEKLPTEHTIFYLVEGEYKDVAYVSDKPGVFTPNSTETKLDLKVYETTTSDETINIGQLHYILAFTPNLVNVAQIFIVNNNGNRTFIGQDGQTFAFALPDSAANVIFQEAFPGARFIQTNSGYADTAPITPGAESVSIIASYDVPFEADTLTIEVPLPTDVTSLNVLMSKQGAKLNSEQVQFVEMRQIQDNTYEIFRGTNLQEDTLTLQLSNLNDLEFASVTNVPGATVPADKPLNQELLRWFIIGLGVVATVVAGVVYPLTRPQLTHQSSLNYNDPQAQREKLLLTLVRLDEAFEAGELDEGIYRQARTKYKAELAQTMEE
jgi:hypothetical protein